MYIFYDSLKVKENVNYILFYVEYNSFYSLLTVKHTQKNEFLKKDNNKFIVILIIIISGIIFISIIVLIIYFIKKNKNKASKLLETSEKENTNEIQNNIDYPSNVRATPYPTDINMSAPPSVINYS